MKSWALFQDEDHVFLVDGSDYRIKKGSQLFHLC